jgi:multidrug efflux pump subunit AcrA (membrane-fusion protein)
VYVSPARQQLIGVRTAVVEPRELGTTVRTVGTLAYDETRVAQIHTKISGWVERVYVDYIGKDIRRDEPLLTVYSPELVSTQTEYLLALRNKAQFDGSPIATTRAAAEPLPRRGPQTLGRPRGAHQAGAERQVRHCLMLLAVQRIVLERNAFPGQYITPEMTTFKIADLSTIWAFGAVFEYELPLIKLGQEAEIEFPYGQSKRQLKGRITFIAPEIDPQTRRVRIRAEFPNPGQTLKPETYVTMVLRSEGGRRLAIPKEAVIDNGEKRYALVAHPNGYFAPKEIQVGPRATTSIRSSAASEERYGRLVRPVPDRLRDEPSRRHAVDDQHARHGHEGRRRPEGHAYAMLSPRSFRSRPRPLAAQVHQR